MKLSLWDLCATFQECTVWANSIIEDGFSSRLGILEETITDINLITIARKHSDFILTKKFSRREEGSKSGADWLRCIGEPGAWLSLWTRPPTRSRASKTVTDKPLASNNNAVGQINLHRESALRSVYLPPPLAHMLDL